MEGSGCTVRGWGGGWQLRQGPGAHQGVHWVEGLAALVGAVEGACFKIVYPLHTEGWEPLEIPVFSLLSAQSQQSVGQSRGQRWPPVVGD